MERHRADPLDAAAGTTSERGGGEVNKWMTAARRTTTGQGHASRRKVPGTMNAMERQWFEVLQTYCGVAAIEYERVTFKLADDTRYTPDFYVLRESGTVEFYECKGFMEDHARVKVKVAADMFPEFAFFLVVRKTKKQGGGWDVKRVGTT